METIEWGELSEAHAGRSVLVPFPWADEPLPFTYVRPSGAGARTATGWDDASGEPLGYAPTALHVLRWPDGAEGDVQHFLDTPVELGDDAEVTPS